MSVCVYDNPASMCREAWQDGKVIAHVSMDMLFSKDYKGHRRLFFGLACKADWCTGKIVWGDANAMYE